MAAIESVAHGIPAFVSVPCAASPLSSNKVENLSSPYKPSKQIIEQQCASLAYGQFTIEEIENGTAYELTEKYS